MFHVKGERKMKMVFFGIALLGALGLVIAPDASAEKKKKIVYEEVAVSDGGTVTGKIMFKGAAPEPKVHELAKFPNTDFCSQISDGKGGRSVQQVNVGKDGTLQDVVVTIGSIEKGKKFDFKGTDIEANTCRFLIQGGPSTLTGVVKKKAEFRVLNTDADPNDPKAETGVLHNPHTYEVVGAKSKTIFNVPLPEKGQTINKPLKLRKVRKSHVLLECDQHNFMQAFFKPVTNPYYAVVGEGGSFSIDGIPPGDYEIEAWHPILGKVTQKVSVPASGTAKAEFTFSN